MTDPRSVTAPGKARTGRKYDVASPTQGGHSRNDLPVRSGIGLEVGGWNCNRFTPAGAAVYATQRTTCFQVFPRIY